MELVYLYVKEYHNIHEQGFNFSQDVNLSFKENVIMVRESDANVRLPEQFWGKNIQNLSMIVGNNGAGKTSLMQYLIGIFLEAHDKHQVGGTGALILGEEDTLYGYCSGEWKESLVKISMVSGKYKYVKWMNGQNVRDILGKTKLVYLTNALSRADNQRGWWYGCDRFKPFYDCSVGNVIYSDGERDVNKKWHQHESVALDTYFTYEQYKQIKFAFDKRQIRILNRLKEQGYPVPAPTKLHIDLLMDNQMDIVIEEAERGNLGWELEMRIFPFLYDDGQKEAYSGGTDLRQEEYGYKFLEYQLSRSVIWCAVRSAARLMDRKGKQKLYEFLSCWEMKTQDFTEILEKMWKKVDEIAKLGLVDRKSWNVLSGFRSYYFKFLDFIKSEKLEKHFKIESRLLGRFSADGDRSVLNFSIATDDADWFMEFLQKYRYTCNPDYFLDFRWGLSSGESNLLSMFASLYYIYDEDYTNSKNGDYQIYNEFQGNRVKCDSVVLLMDEADLTYHPEWQRVFIALLTAFLPEVYPPRCCPDIQVVLSTHSPILLGDVPRQNVIYLKRNPENGCTEVDKSDHVETFGQNVHLLFKDSFFLEHGTMGLFAQDKISDILTHIQNVEKEFDRAKEDAPEFYMALADRWKRVLENECRPYAELIGEPIIKKKVLMQIDELEKKILSDRRISRLQRMSDSEIEEEIRRLQKEQDRRKNDKNFIV